MVVTTTWWAEESHVIEVTRAFNPVRTAFCDEGLALLSDVARLDPISQSEIVQVSALLQTRNTLAVAWEAAFAGYAAQAMALCRTASEYIGIAATSFFLILVAGVAVLRASQYLRDVNAEWAASADAYMYRVGEWLESVEV